MFKHNFKVIYVSLKWILKFRGILNRFKGFLDPSTKKVPQGFVASFLESFTGWWAITQLLCSKPHNKLHKELLKRNKQNLYVRPSAPLCVMKILTENSNSRTCKDSRICPLDFHALFEYVPQGDIVYQMICHICHRGPSCQSSQHVVLSYVCNNDNATWPSFPNKST